MNGNWCEGAALDNLVQDYFTNIFSTGNSDVGTALDGVSQRVSNEDNMMLTKPYTHEKAKLALFSMSPDKSPGPDGFNLGFF